jgi:hypothetical protein
MIGQASADRVAAMYEMKPDLTCFAFSRYTRDNRDQHPIHKETQWQNQP